jgi:hypothetical protein
MRKYKVAILLIGIVVAVTIAIGFTLIGSPVNQQLIRYDETRYNDMQQIKYRIESYYQSNNQLPSSLQDLNYSGMSINDPQTGKIYTYTISDVDSYKICTEFSTNAEEFKKYSNLSYFDNPISHTKGYSCIPFTVPSSIKPLR